jgi:hypothetical protein
MKILKNIFIIIFLISPIYFFIEEFTYGILWYKLKTKNEESVLTAVEKKYMKNNRNQYGPVLKYLLTLNKHE